MPTSTATSSPTGWRCGRVGSRNRCRATARSSPTDGVVVGFAHTILDDDPTWGALLDNLPVVHDRQGQGVGTRLMTETAMALIRRTPSAGLYLWMLEGNTSARSFSGSLGGRCVGSEVTEAPGGGAITGLRYAWPDPARLLERN